MKLYVEIKQLYLAVFFFFFNFLDGIDSLKHTLKLLENSELLVQCSYDRHTSIYGCHTGGQSPLCTSPDTRCLPLKYASQV